MITELDGLALNVWYTGDNETPAWQMAIYPWSRADGTDSSQYIEFKPTSEQIERYLELSQDSDWWVHSAHPDYEYILFNIKR